MTYKLICGNSLLELKKLDSNSIDSVVTDPPYELGFMGKEWDKTGIANNVELWKEVYRVLKPGGHMLAFSGTRTYHRMVCAIEDSGFEIRDQLAWIYGSGFPKSQNVGKMIDKKAGKKVEKGEAFNVVGMGKSNGGSKFRSDHPDYKPYDPQTDDAKKYDGWGTALKPAQEPIVLARKPLSEKTVAANVIKYGTGAINIDDSRVGDEDIKINVLEEWTGFGQKKNPEYNQKISKGRWPANIIHDGSDEVVQLFPNSKGSAARFFYSAKANKQDRNEGCEKIEAKRAISISCNGPEKKMHLGISSLKGEHKQIEPKNNIHPTVKPTELMRYLIRLITPSNGVVLDPFNGSGSTGKAAMLEGKHYIGIDLSTEYIKISEARISKALSDYNKQHDADKFYVAS
jgi:site-specific DNA-methyltransferase (adenine-specific)